VLRNFDMAVDEYKERAGTSWFKIELAAIDNLTLEHIRCTCPVLGAWQDGLIVEYQGHSRAVGKSQLHHNLYPTEAVLLEGEPLTIQTQRVDMKSRSLNWLMEALEGKPNVYLLGELWIDADKVPAVTEIDLYHPVWWSGDRVRLHYARAEDLREYRRLVAIRGEVMVQGWGAAPLPELGGQVGEHGGGLPRGLEGLF
jgi:inner membrane protein